MSSRKSSIESAIIIVFALSFVFAQVLPVQASEPSDMSLTYDFNSQILSVNVSHYVSNTKTHYIDLIEIERNGLFVLNGTYVNQTYDWGVYDTFSVAASVGDNITVTANCKKGYSITRWLIVTSDTATNTVSETTTITDNPTGTTDDPNSPGTPANLAPVIGVGVFLVILSIVLFAWLNPDRVPEGVKHFGSRIRDGFQRLWVGFTNLINQLRAKVTSK